MPLIRARDLRTNIKEYGFEQGVVVTLEQFLDEYAGYRQHMRDMTDLLSRCIDNLDRLATAGNKMADKINTIKRERDQHDESDPTQC